MMDIQRNIEKEHLALRKKKVKTTEEKREMKSLRQRIRREKNRVLHSAPSLLHDRISDQLIILILNIIIIIIIISFLQALRPVSVSSLIDAPSLLHDRISEQVIILILFIIIIIIIISFLQAKQRRVRLHTPIIIDLSDDKVPLNPKKFSLCLGGGDSREDSGGGEGGTAYPESGEVPH